MEKKKRNEQTPEQVRCKDLHAQLKKIVASELEQLPETLAKMEPLPRAKILLQLLPYVAPKIANVNNEYGEQPEWNWGWN